MADRPFRQTHLGVLFKPVEVRIGSNGRLERIGSIWHDDLERARRAAYQLAASPWVLRVEIVRADGQVVETIN